MPAGSYPFTCTLHAGMNSTLVVSGGAPLVKPTATITILSKVAAFEFLLHQLENNGIAEPGLDIGAHPIGPDEGHDLQAGRLGVHQHMRSGIRTAGREDAGDAMLFEQREHFIQLVVGFGSQL